MVLFENIISRSYVFRYNLLFDRILSSKSTESCYCEPESDSLLLELEETAGGFCIFLVNLLNKFF